MTNPSAHEIVPSRDEIGFVRRCLGKEPENFIANLRRAAFIGIDAQNPFMRTCRRGKDFGTDMFQQLPWFHWSSCHPRRSAQNPDRFDGIILRAKPPVYLDGYTSSRSPRSSPANVLLPSKQHELEILIVRAFSVRHRQHKPFASVEKPGLEDIRL